MSPGKPAAGPAGAPAGEQACVAFAAFSEPHSTTRCGPRTRSCGHRGRDRHRRTEAQKHTETRRIAQKRAETHRNARKRSKLVPRHNRVRRLGPGPLALHRWLHLWLKPSLLFFLFPGREDQNISWQAAPPRRQCKRLSRGGTLFKRVREQGISI